MCHTYETYKLDSFLRTFFIGTKTEENDKVLFSQSNLHVAFCGVIFKFLQWPGEFKLAERDD